MSQDGETFAASSGPKPGTSRYQGECSTEWAYRAAYTPIHLKFSTMTLSPSKLEIVLEFESRGTVHNWSRRTHRHVIWRIASVTATRWAPLSPDIEQCEASPGSSSIPLKFSAVTHVFFNNRYKTTLCWFRNDMSYKYKCLSSGISEEKCRLVVTWIV